MYAVQVDHLDRLALRMQLFGQQFGRLGRVTVEARIRHQHAALLRLPRRPEAVKRQRAVERLAAELRAVQRADRPDLQRGGLFQQPLHLRAVFADDVAVIAPRLVRPCVGIGQRAEIAESVRGKEHLLSVLIDGHDLRPMHHRRKHEMQRMAAERQRAAVRHRDALLRERIVAAELIQNRKRSGVGDQL